MAVSAAGGSCVAIVQVQELIESADTDIAEADSRNTRGAVCAALNITEYKLHVSVTHNKINRLRWKPEIHRYCDQTCTHDAEVRRDVISRVCGKQPNAIAAFKTTSRKRARDGICREIKVSVADFSYLPLRAQVDDRDF